MERSSNPIDPLVANILAQKARHSSRSSSTSGSSLDALLSDPSDPISSAYRAQRLDQLSHLLSATSTSTTRNSTVTTTVTTYTHEQELMTTIAHAPRSVVHFFRPAFARCTIMDDHLARLAALHPETSLVRIDAEHAPFLCERLRVRELPCLVAYLAGEGVQRIVGFEGLGGDGFKTGVLERRLVACGVLALELLGLADGVVGKGEGDQGEDEEEGGEREWRRRRMGRKEKRAVVDEDGDDWDD